MDFLKMIVSLLPTETAFAHCDVPCGIYTPEPAKIAAKTVLVMVQKIKGLKKPEDEAGKLDYKNNLTRMIWTKEEHARKCKEEILTLWTDYFKPEHLQMFPDLHDTFWQTAKLVSKNKQHVDEDTAQELVKAVDKIAQLFEKAEEAKKSK